MGRIRDLTGKRFGRLVVLEEAGRKNRQVTWKCVCDCGKTVSVRGSDLRGGQKSCGCISREIARNSHKTHDKSKTRIYRVWHGIKCRCCNPNDKYYSRYGGAGISVCEAWRESFENFYAWSIANGYSDELSIDRIDNSKGYSPDNCRWATPQQQTENRQCTQKITFNGKTQTLMQWANETGISYTTLWWRIKQGWEPEKALTQETGG